MPEPISKKPFGQLLLSRPEYGANAEAQPYNGVDPRYLRITDIDDSGRLLASDIRSIPKRVAAPYMLDVGDIAIARTGNTVGKAYLHIAANGPVAFAGYLIRFKLDPEQADSRFVFHYVRSAEYRSWIHRTLRIGAQPNINAAEYATLGIPDLDISEQRRIAEILDTADEAIQKTEALIAKLKQMKAGLLHDLLTRGIDENGELRDPASFIGGVPRQWKTVQLRDVVPHTEYGISTALQDLGDLPVLRMNNFQDGEACLESIRYASTPVPAQLLLRSGDVLFNRTNSYVHVGRTGIWRGQIDKATFASYLVRLNPDKSQLTSEYLNHWLNLPSTQIAIRKFATPAVQQVNINPTMLRKATISLPRSVAEQQEITRRIDAVGVRIGAETREIEKLKALKFGLMHDLLTGQKRVNRLADAATAAD